MSGAAVSSGSGQLSKQMNQYFNQDGQSSHQAHLSPANILFLLQEARQPSTREQRRLWQLRRLRRRRPRRSSVIPVRPSPPSQPSRRRPEFQPTEDTEKSFILCLVTTTTTASDSILVSTWVLYLLTQDHITYFYTPRQKTVRIFSDGNEASLSFPILIYLTYFGGGTHFGSIRELIPPLVNPLIS